MVPFNLPKVFISSSSIGTNLAIGTSLFVMMILRRVFLTLSITLRHSALNLLAFIFSSIMTPQYQLWSYYHSHIKKGNFPFCLGKLFLKNTYPKRVRKKNLLDNN